MDRLADGVVAAEREADVGDAARHLGARQVLLDPAGGLDEVACRSVACSSMPVATAKTFGSKMMSSAGNPTSSTRMPVGPRADLLAPLEVVGLPVLVERHDHGGGAVLAAQRAPGRRNSSSPSLSEIELTIGLPCTFLSPASITSHFEESTITGTRLMSGSVATSLRKRSIAATPSSIPSSMLTSMTCAPAIDLLGARPTARCRSRRP